ncbi:MAG: YqjF family protein [Planctomycetota bacterium]
MTPAPPFRQIFWQTWRDLVFVHWAVDPAVVAPLLPPELEVDTFEGKAYVALVPFLMTGIRCVGLPPIPGTSRTLETNVRTYVRRRGVAREPIPAVWFHSLEAASSLAVRAARWGFGLPYFKATMRYERATATDAAGRALATRVATSERRWPQPTPARSLVDATFAADASFAPARPGTLEHFLVERYALYAQRGRTLLHAEVRHAPYRIRAGALRAVDPGLVVAAGVPAEALAGPALVHEAQDVTVRIGAPRAVR